MNALTLPAPIPKAFLTPGVGVLVALAIAGFCVAVYRFAFGLAATTHLDQQHPWGLWIALDVATNIALAAGGFTTAALAHVFHREKYHAIARPALLAALLGYTFYGIGLLADLGRYYNVWHPILPSMWQGNSVLFEVGMCVMCYLVVLYVEFLPAVCERFIRDERFPRLATHCAALRRFIDKTMFLFMLAGVTLSCLHQSSIGNLMVIAPTKMHALWYTPILPVLFLLSAFAVGFPIVILQSLYASWAFERRPDMGVLSSLARNVPIFLGLYLAFKLGDMFIRESYTKLGALTPQSVLFTIEMAVGLVVPLVCLLFERVRRHPKGLLLSSLFVVLGVTLNRINVFLVAYEPPYATTSYFPSAAEIIFTLGLFAALILAFRFVAIHFPVFAPDSRGSGT